jgi:hypothetical protein
MNVPYAGEFKFNVHLSFIPVLPGQFIRPFKPLTGLPQDAHDKSCTKNGQGGPSIPRHGSAFGLAESAIPSALERPHHPKGPGPYLFL